MLILGIILFGMLIGAAAQLIVGRSAKGVDWGLALAAGLVGSFIGGLVVSLISGDGVAFRPSGIIGSLAGAIIVTFAWQWWRRRGAVSSGRRFVATSAGAGRLGRREPVTIPV